MSDANRTEINIGRHPSGQVPRIFPITDAQKPAGLDTLRTIGQPNFAFTPKVVESAEIRADRQRAKPKNVGGEAGGTVGFELSPITFDDVIESALFSVWVNTFRATGTNVEPVSETSFVVTTGGGADSGDFPEGQIVFLDYDNGTTVVKEAFEITVRSYLDPDITLTVAHIGPTAPAPTFALATDAATVLSVIGVQAQAADEIEVTSVDVGDNSAVLTFTGDALAAFDLIFGITGAQTAMVAGVWVKLAAFANASNNVWVRIRSVTAATWVVEKAEGMVVEAAGPDNAQVFFGDYVRNGIEAVTDHSFLVERVFQDHTPEPLHEVHIGGVINQLQLTLDPENIVVGSVEFFANNAEIADAVDRDSGGAGIIYVGTAPTVTPAPEEDFYNTSDNIGRVSTGDEDITAGDGLDAPLQVQLTINNNGRRRPAVGFRGSVSIGVGEFAVNGNYNTYFDSKDELSDVIANTTKNFDLAFQDLLTGRSMVFDAPATAYTGGAVQNTAKNTDTSLPIPWGAFKDPTLGYTLQVQRVSFVV